MLTNDCYKRKKNKSCHLGCPKNIISLIYLYPLHDIDIALVNEWEKCKPKLDSLVYCGNFQ